MIELAKKIAAANDDYPEWRLAAVCVKGGSVQSVGWSKLKRDPLFLDQFYNCSVHAEVDCLKRMNFQAKNCVLHVARLRKGGGFGLAKPCANCATMIESSGVKKVIYTISDDEFGVWKPTKEMS